MASNVINIAATLQTLKSGDVKTGFAMGPVGAIAMPGGRRSGFAPKGNYKAKIISAAWEDKKGDKAGKNLAVSVEITEPKQFRGVQIHAYHPAPESNSPSDNGFKWCVALVKSIWSAIGKLEDLDKQKNAQFPPPEKLIGKEVHVALVDETDEQYKGQSKLDRYLLLEVFTANPGAIGGGEAPPQRSNGTAKPNGAAAASSGEEPPAGDGEPAAGAEAGDAGGDSMWS